MKRALVVIALAAGVSLLRPAPAYADLTAFWGMSSTPELRSARGFAFGINLLVVGFEFEFANTVQNEAKGAPGLSTKMFNGMLMTPTGGTQLYLTAGGGTFREEYRDRRESNVGTNVGGGIKMNLAGPLRLRLDYRIFVLRGDPLYKNPKRFYGGISLSF
jgi:opacity protein-like surface antigen